MPRCVVYHWPVGWGSPRRSTDGEVVSAVNAEFPRVPFLPAASGDDEDYAGRFEALYADGLGYETDVL